MILTKKKTLKSVTITIKICLETVVKKKHKTLKIHFIQQIIDIKWSIACKICTSTCRNKTFDLYI